MLNRIGALLFSRTAESVLRQRGAKTRQSAAALAAKKCTAPPRRQGPPIIYINMQPHQETITHISIYCTAQHKYMKITSQYLCILYFPHRLQTAAYYTLVERGNLIWSGFSARLEEVPVIESFNLFEQCRFFMIAIFEPIF